MNRKDFEPNDRVMWFSGDHFEEGAMARGREKALGVVRDAAEACHSRDLRQDTMMLAAIEYLKQDLSKPVLAERFMKALDHEDPVQRFTAARAAYGILAKACRVNIARGSKSEC